MNAVEILSSNLGNESFVEPDGNAKPLLSRRTNRRIIIYLDREVIGPFVNRSTDPSDTIRYRFPDEDGRKGREVVRVPSRKFKSKEKLRGLEVCRAFGLVDPNYEYNAVESTEMLNNPNSVLFGDTETGGNAAGIPSKFIYGEGLSVEDAAKAVQPLTHNALSEEGTMWNRKEGEFRTSLFETVSVLPGTHIIQTITVDSPTPESLAHLLISLTATRYGAQTSVTGSNIRNRIMVILATTDEPPVTAYTLVRGTAEGKYTHENLVELTTRALSGCSGKVISGNEAEKLQSDVQKASDLETLYKNLADQARLFHEFVYPTKSRKKRGAKTENISEG